MYTYVDESDILYKLVEHISVYSCVSFHYIIIAWTYKNFSTSVCYLNVRVPVSLTPNLSFKLAFFTLTALWLYRPHTQLWWIILWWAEQVGSPCALPDWWDKSVGESRCQICTFGTNERSRGVIKKTLPQKGLVITLWKWIMYRQYPKTCVIQSG